MKSSEHPLPDGTVLTYALVGNQNCGKTTLFNQLTGSNQHVGNFPGVTVDRKGRCDQKVIPRHWSQIFRAFIPCLHTAVKKLFPGIFVLNEMPKAIINIVDATNIERNLYLTMQLLEMNIPMVVALNMMDEVTGNSGSIDINGMEALLGVPVIPISAAKMKVWMSLSAMPFILQNIRNARPDRIFVMRMTMMVAVHRCIHAVIHLIEDHARRPKLPVRFAAKQKPSKETL